MLGFSFGVPLLILMVLAPLAWFKRRRISLGMNKNPLDSHSVYRKIK
jgi:hypothetical protein